MKARDLTALIRPHLFSGEQLLWSGRPRQGPLFRPVDALLIPFSLVWGGFAITFGSAFLAHGATSIARGTISPIGLFGALFGAAFSFAGLYVILGRFLADAYYRFKLVYALTDRRAIIVSGTLWPSTTSVDLGNLSNVRFVEHRSGRGTIHFTPPSQGQPRWHTTLGQEPMFFQISGARKVYEILQDTARRSARP